jgi:hypothetical protein
MEKRRFSIVTLNLFQGPATLRALSFSSLILLAAMTVPAKAGAPPLTNRPSSDGDTCPPMPHLVVSQDFADSRGAFVPGSRAFRRLQTRFAAAFRRACDHGLLRGWPVMASRAEPNDSLFLKNRIYGGAWIYLEGEDGSPSSTRHMVLESHFLTANGDARLPTAAHIYHAILCGVDARYVNPDQDVLVCLPS